MNVIQHTQDVHSFTVFPEHMNYGGSTDNGNPSLFGGVIMLNIDLAAAKVVRRALYNTGATGCATASIDRIDFLKPGKVGDLISMYATIKTLGHSSIGVKIKVVRESITGEKEDMCTAATTFVATKDGKVFNHNLCFADTDETSK